MLTKEKEEAIDQAIAWAKSKVDFDTVDLVRENPWGNTLRLSSKREQYYLKTLPAALTPSISIAEDVSRIIPEHAPRLVSKNKARGWFLLEDHQGNENPHQHGLNEFGALDAYANLQANAAKQIHKFKTRARFSWQDTWDGIGAFCSPHSLTTNDEAALKDFLGEDEASFFHELLGICSEVINGIVEDLDQLPPTINHCDLHSNNYGVTNEGQFKFHDWDNALIGPAGLSLNAFCGSVTDFFKFLCGGPAENHSTSAILHYCSALEHEGYAERAVLENALPAAILAGLFNSLLSYKSFPPRARDDWEVCTPDVTRLVSDITRICFLLGAENPELVVRLATLIGPDRAGEQYLELVGRAEPEALRSVIDFAECPATLKLQLRKALEIRVAVENASACDSVPTIDIPWMKSAEDRFSEARIGEASGLFAQYGCLAIENAFPNQQLTDCLKAFRGQAAVGAGEALAVGNKRYMMPLSISGPFNSPEIYASSPLMKILERVLGQGFVLGSMSIVVSKPGAEVQHLHMDHPALFPELGHSASLPSHAVTVLVPLVDIDEKIGGTEVVKGSHICSSSEVDQLDHQSRTMQLGSCLMFDYRLYHRGLANRSRRERPVLSLVYQRPWFMDATNFHNHEPLQISKRDFQRIPEWAQGLFAQAAIVREKQGEQK